MGRYRATYCYSLFLESKGEVLEAEMERSTPEGKERVYDYNAESVKGAIEKAEKKLNELMSNGNKVVLESIVKVVFEKEK